VLGVVVRDDINFWICRVLCMSEVKVLLCSMLVAELIYTVLVKEKNVDT
jgi:hypothetical protein